MVTQLSGIVLAAGRSTRMGRDKALLQQDGVPMWHRQRDVLANAGASELFLSARPEQEWTYQTQGFSARLHDTYSGCGPIMGVTAGLERMSQTHLAVLAIDLPAMTSDWFKGLLARCEPGVGVVGRCDGFFEPLAAICPIEMKWLAWETIAVGEYGLQQLLRAAVEKGLMTVREIAEAERPLFRNWNS